jgi:hypothetical protein
MGRQDFISCGPSFFRWASVRIGIIEIAFSHQPVTLLPEDT